MLSEMLGVKKIPVLLVEDSRNEAHATERLLYAIDDEFSISRVARLDEALDELSKNPADAVILDLGLPDSSGPESIATLGQHFPHVPIVVLSGRDDPETIKSALQFGAQEFLTKSECSGKGIRQALLGAIIRKSLRNSIT